MRNIAKLVSVFVTTCILIGCNNTHKSKNSNAGTAFTKIIFHSTGCFGRCPTYHLKVNSDKTLKLFAETVYKNGSGRVFDADSSKIGYYTGLVSDSDFANLNRELKAIGLDSLKFEGPNCCDGSVITLIVYYNGKRKFLRSMFPPDKASKLISTFYSICENSGLKRSSRKFDIEQGEALK
jgi:hypothetical protein